MAFGFSVPVLLFFNKPFFHRGAGTMPMIYVWGKDKGFLSFQDISVIIVPPVILVIFVILVILVLVSCSSCSS